MASVSKPNRYVQLIERAFLDNYKKGDREVVFSRAELEKLAKTLKISLPKNLGDVLYSFRYRASLPTGVTRTAPRGKEWAIFPYATGPTRYCFRPVKLPRIVPDDTLDTLEIPDATPGMIEQYALNDEQALLAKLRYNRLIDLFTGITTYSLQSHLRTTIKGVSQVEIDEVYVGLDDDGRRYAIPIQAKGKKDHLSVVQIWQDYMVCAKGDKFPGVVALPIAAQFLPDGSIAMFSFDWNGKYEITVKRERHYRLVKPTPRRPA